MQVMKDAAMLPIMYAKALHYRSPNATNVYSMTSSACTTTRLGVKS